MNPIFSWIVAHSTARLAARKCPKCGHIQLITRDQQTVKVACSRCGTSLSPPPRA